MMRFAHLADCHIGGWREEEIKKLSIESFKAAIALCIEKGVDFIIISGDIFDTTLPPVDIMKEAVIALMAAKKRGMPVYIIHGSHDFSPSGKSMISVFEEAGLFSDVVKFEDGRLLFTTDRSGAKITGMLGRKGGLERIDYNNLEKRHLEEESGFKIFMFHTAITEFKPQGMKMDSEPLASLPSNFDYYAGGHMHYIYKGKKDRGMVVYPGALFPNNFKELEEFKHGGIYLYEDGELSYIPIKLKDVVPVLIDANNKTLEDVENEIRAIKDFGDKIVTIRIEGTLKSGKPAEIRYKELFSRMGSAYCILKNTSGLSARETEIAEVKGSSVEDIEEEVIKEQKERQQLISALIHALDKEKDEGEKTADFEVRVLRDARKILDV